MRLASLAVLLSLLACRDPGGHPGPLLLSESRAGSRLVPLFVCTGGVKSGVNWWDRTHGQYCDFGRASDGSLRCLPTARLPAELMSYFADPACTRPVFFEDSPVTRPLVVEERTSCGSVLRAHAPGEAVAVVYHSTTAGCTGPLSEAGARELGLELDAGAFVLGTRSTEGAGAWVNWIRGEDGSRYVEGLALSAQGEPCWPALDAYDTWRCFPRSRPLAWVDSAVFADAQCSSRAVDAPVCQPSIQVAFDSYGLDPTCLDGPRVRAYELGEPLASGFGYGPSGACSPLTAPPGRELRLRGAELPASSFVGGTYVAVPLGGPVSLATIDFLGVRIPGGPARVGPGQSCSPQFAADGVARCLPEPGYPGYREIDFAGQCGARLWEDAGCGAQYAAFLEGTPERVHVYALGPAYPGVYVSPGPECYADYRPYIRFRTIGTELPPAMFPEVTFDPLPP